MTYIQERGSTHVYHVNRMSKEEMDHMISLCVHEQPAYCVAACPFKADTKEMLFYAAKGNFKKALAIYEKITPFPMILCNGCTAPCEEKCRLCELGDGISIREVERAIVRYGEPGKRSSVFRIRKKKKAVIFGSGLFPLFLAGELEKKMYPATIYCQEKDYEAYIAAAAPELLESDRKNEVKRLSSMDLSFEFGCSLDLPFIRAKMRLSQFTGAGYGINSIRNKSTTVFTNHAWGSAFRAYGSPQSYMGSEIAIDVLAAKMGIDPFDIREMNCYKESEGSTIPTGYPPEVYCEEELFKTARPLYEAAKKRVAEKNAASDGKIKYGIGVSLGVYGCGLDGVDTSNAFAELNPDGTVTMYAAWEDHGQGADMGVLVSSHETLRQAGIRPEQIKLVMNDTKTCPNAGPAGGSRSQVMSGNACRLAAENLVAAMKKEDGTFRTYDEMVAEGLATKYEGNWVTTFCADHPIDQDTAQGDPFATYMYTIFLPEVAVNTETGKVKVEKFTCVADVGTIMNRLLVEGNFYGGLVQGIGLALTEDFEDLNHDTSLKNCGIPYPNDAPDDIELHFNETYRPSGPYGAAGCGEAPLDAPHPAILNAIYNATGARITRVPARPEKVLAALKELEK